MIPSAQPISPLRQRMLEDMRMRKLEPRTQEAYIRAVRGNEGPGRGATLAALQALPHAGLHLRNPVSYCLACHGPDARPAFVLWQLDVPALLTGHLCARRR